MKLAIIGSGVSGLVVAHHLHRRHQITLYEADAHVGGHTHTLRVDTADETHHVDTGFVVYNERNYPHFAQLIRQLGVATRPTSMSFSVRAGGGGFEYSSRIPAGIFAMPTQLLRPAFQRMLFDYGRFRRSAHLFLHAGELDDPSMREFVGEGGFSSHFIDRMLVPLGASIWSADRSRFLSFPARYVLRFFRNHGLISSRGRPQWRTIEGGSSRYVEQLIRPFGDRIRLNSPVRAVARRAEYVEVRAAGTEAERYDRVVIATHSDQALRLLQEPTVREHELLSAFPYQENRVVLHTDASLLPTRRRAWASWNYHLDADPERPTGITYHMNRLQGLAARSNFCVTLNRDEAIAPHQVRAQLRYSHPLFTHRSTAAQQRHHELNGPNRTHFCGAYWGTGFHEDGVASALRVCAALGERVA